MGYNYSWTILYEPCLGGKQLSPGSSLGWSLTNGLLGINQNGARKGAKLAVHNNERIYETTI